MALNKRLQITPYQAFYSKKPNVSELRTFGCKVFAQVADDQRKKLDPKSELGMHLGPCTNGPGALVLVHRPEYQGPQKYTVKTVRDMVTYETIKDCASQSSYQFWNGKFLSKLPEQPDSAYPHTLQPDSAYPHTLQGEVETLLRLPLNGPVAHSSPRLGAGVKTGRQELFQLLQKNPTTGPSSQIDTVHGSESPLSSAGQQGQDSEGLLHDTNMIPGV